MHKKTFLHGSRTVVIVVFGFRCLGSSCLDLGLASAPDCLASVSMSLPRCRLALVLAVAALPLPLPRRFCLDYNPGINWYRLRLGVKCSTGAVLDMLAAILQTLRLAANRRHSSIVFLPVVVVVRRP